MNWLRRLFLLSLLIFQGAGFARAAAADIAVTPQSLDFKYTTGGTVPAAQTLAIKSTTSTVLSFTITVSGSAYSVQWLTLAAISGSTAVSIKVYVNPSGLPSGNYAGSLTINAPNAVTTSQIIPVTLEVSDAAAKLSALPAALTFTCTGTVCGASQTITVSAGSVSPLATTVTVTGATWLTVTPKAAVTILGGSQTLTASVDATGLTPAVKPYSGTITIASSNASNKSVTVGVSLTVSAANPTVTAVSPPGVSAGKTSSYTVTITGTNFLATTTAISGATALPVTFINSNTLYVAIPSSLLQTAGTAVPITLTTPTAAAVATTTFNVYAAGTVKVWAVQNAASYTAGTVSPGEIISIYGIGLGPAGSAGTPYLAYSGAGPLPTVFPTTAPSTSVKIGTYDAPILLTSDGQINCIVPYGLKNVVSGTSVNVVVTYNGNSSTALPVLVADTDPGVFTLNGTGSGQGAIVNWSDGSINGAKAGAARGSWVYIYVTGFGTVSCVDITGPPSSTCPAAEDETLYVTGTVTPVAAVSVTIGGVPVSQLVAQAPLGSVAGLLQINAVVPDTVTVGSSVPVLVSVGSLTAQASVTMVVK